MHLLAPASLGAGDVKLAGSLGAALAGLSWPAAALAAVLAGLLTRGCSPWSPGRRLVPHGPGMLAAAWVVAWSASLAGGQVRRSARGGGG